MPCGGLAGVRGAQPRFRRAGAAFRMAAGDEDAVAKAKAAAQRAEQNLFGIQDESAATGGQLDDSKLQALLNTGQDSSSADEAEKAKQRMDTFEAQLKEVRDTAPTEESKKELDLRGVRINAAGQWQNYLLPCAN